MFDSLPKLIPRRWVGPRRNQVTAGNHRHIVGDDKSGYISEPLFNGDAPTDIDELVAVLELYGLDGSGYTPGSGTGTTWYNGSGVPSSGLGINGDYYLDVATGDVYVKVAGSWV